MNRAQNRSATEAARPEAGEKNRPSNVYPKPLYAWYVVTVLTVAYIFSFIDRQILNLMVVPIQKDLALSDTQMSLLQGIAFALFYTILGIPLGRLADRISRRRIIGAGVFFWSLMTMTCGLAGSFATLFLARIGVGAGEASLSPSAYSLIGDYFPPHKVTKAIGVYAGGSFLGAGLAYIVGGAALEFIMTLDVSGLPVLRDLKAWQAAFILVGFPGLFLALLMITVKEPARHGLLQRTGNQASKAIPLREVLAYIGQHRRVYGCHFFGYATVALLSYAILAWMPTYFIRNFGWSASKVGMVYGCIILVFGTLGVVGGGWLADMARNRGFRDANLRIVMYGVLVLIPFGIAGTLVDQEKIAVGLIAVATICWSIPHGLGPAALIAITPNQLRGQISALYLLTLNLVGLGFGPLSVALLTDYFFKDPQKVGVSLSIVTVTACMLAALVLYFGLGPYRKTLDLAEQGWKKGDL